MRSKRPREHNRALFYVWFGLVILGLVWFDRIMSCQGVKKYEKYEAKRTQQSSFYVWLLWFGLSWLGLVW